MRELQLRQAKATLSAVIDDAKRGEPSIITRHGKPEAVVVGFEEWQRISEGLSFGRMIWEAPFESGDIPERTSTTVRDIDL
jgi:antitoxin Phd